MGSRDNLSSLEEALEGDLGDLTPLENGDGAEGQSQDDPDAQPPDEGDEGAATDDGGSQSDDEGDQGEGQDGGDEEGDGQQGDDSAKTKLGSSKSSYDKAVAQVKKLSEELYGPDSDEYQDFMNDLRTDRGAKARTKQTATSPAKAGEGGEAAKPKTISEMTQDEFDEMLGSSIERRMQLRDVISTVKRELAGTVRTVEDFIAEENIPDEVVQSALSYVKRFGPQTVTESGKPIPGALTRRAQVILDRLALHVERNKQSDSGKTDQQKEKEIERRATDKGRQIAKVSQPKGGGHLGGQQPQSYQRKALANMQRSRPAPLSSLIGQGSKK